MRIAATQQDDLLRSSEVTFYNKASMFVLNWDRQKGHNTDMAGEVNQLFLKSY